MTRKLARPRGVLARAGREGLAGLTDIKQEQRNKLEEIIGVGGGGEPSQHERSVCAHQGLVQQPLQDPPSLHELVPDLRVGEAQEQRQQAARQA